MSFQASFVLLCLLSSASAFALNAPAPTPTPQPYGTLHCHSGPRPTTPPYPHDLLRRQSSSASKSAQRTVLEGPDDTCGYLGGASNRPWGCASGNCVFATQTPIINSTQSVGPGSVLCCDPSTGCPSSPAPTACADRYNGIVSFASSVSSSGTASTVSGSSTTSQAFGSADPMTLTCTSGIYIFCNTVTFAAPSISALFCNYISNTAVQNATTTYVGQTDHAFAATVPVFAVSFTPTTSSSSTSLSTSAKSSAKSSSPTAVPNTGGKQKIDKGAVIGGVIGGVVGLALLIGVVLLFLRWRQSGEDEGEASADTRVSEEAVKPLNTA